MNSVRNLGQAILGSSLRVSGEIAGSPVEDVLLDTGAEISVLLLGQNCPGLQVQWKVGPVKEEELEVQVLTRAQKKKEEQELEKLEELDHQSKATLTSLGDITVSEKETPPNSQTPPTHSPKPQTKAKSRRCNKFRNFTPNQQLSPQETATSGSVIPSPSTPEVVQDSNNPLPVSQEPSAEGTNPLPDDVQDLSKDLTSAGPQQGPDQYKELTGYATHR